MQIIRSSVDGAGTHWHGAAPDRLMVHLAINKADTDHEVVHWLDPVTDVQYAAAPSVD